MLTKIFPIAVEGSRPGARLCIYIQDRSQELFVQERPLILLCPGGGYQFTSDREAEPLALRFLAMGYHVAVLRYSCAPAVYPTALLELAQAMKLIHDHAKEWQVLEDKIFVQGCSAGGHLAASLGAFWREKWLAEKTQVPSIWLKPAGLILCYPVITSGEYAHQGSMESLLGANCFDKELLERVSLEKQVTQDMPPVFLWCSFTDPSVPVENSLLFVNALRRQNISTEFHMYCVGGHGLSTCDEQSANVSGFGIQEECQSWLSLVQAWLAGR